MKVRVYNDKPLRALTKEEIVDALTAWIFLRYTNDWS